MHARMHARMDTHTQARTDRQTDRVAPNVNYLPSDHSSLQVINLDKFSKAAGVVVVGCFGIPKGLTETEGEGRNTW